MAGQDGEVLIVGSGQAGAQAAIALRQEGFAGRITMVGEEPDLPYERPPLTKEYLAGERTADRLLLRPPAFWSERRIEIVAATRIARVQAGSATAEDGRIFPFDRLIWAGGGHARRLDCPGAGLGGVHVIRTRLDADALRSDLQSAARVVVVGGGYVGLEAAAVMAKAGRRVTVVEAADRLLARVTAEPVGAFYRQLHEGHGVSILLGAQVAALEGGGRVEAVRLADGQRLAADVVVVGIGLVPSVAALGVDGPGVEVDAHCRTGLAGIYAVGDCAIHSNRYAGGARIRLESVQNAVDMAKAAAAHLVRGDAAPGHDACPWFWSNQYDVRLQTVGLSLGAEDWTVRGDPATGSWSLVYWRGGAIVALDCINAPRDYVQGRALVERGARPRPSAVADPDVALKSLLD